MKQLQPRIDRLQSLSRGLRSEADAFGKDMGGLHFAERNRYVTALRAAAEKLQEARVELVKAKHRINGDP